MSESVQLTRLWKILRLLEDSQTGWSVKELVAETDLNDTTIRQDLKVLQRPFEITETVSYGGVTRWKMPPLGEQMGSQLTELMSPHLAQQLLEPLAGTPFCEGSRSAFSKVQAALGDKALRYLEKLNTGVLTTQIGTSNYEARGELVDRLMVAIEDRKVTLTVYPSMQATEPVEQEVYPLGLIHHRGNRYLIAWSSRRAEVRNFKVDRIDDVDVQNLTSTVPTDFDLADWLSKAFAVSRNGSEDLQNIRIYFSRDAARYVQESHWHESQHFKPQPDGSVIAKFQLPDTQEIKRWVMSFCSGATVLEPAPLRNEIRKELRAMLNGLEMAPDSKA